MPCRGTSRRDSGLIAARGDLHPERASDHRADAAVSRTNDRRQAQRTSVSCSAPAACPPPRGRARHRASSRPFARQRQRPGQPRAPRCSPAGFTRAHARDRRRSTWSLPPRRPSVAPERGKHRGVLARLRHHASSAATTSRTGRCPSRRRPCETKRSWPGTSTTTAAAHGQLERREAQLDRDPALASPRAGGRCRRR